MTERSTKSALLKFRPGRRQLLFFGPAVLIVIAVIFYFGGERYVETDDAYLKAEKINVAAEVSGVVAEVAVKSNQTVHKGDLLFKLDAKPFEIALEQADAARAVALADVTTLRATLEQRKSDLEVAKSNIRFQQQEFTRTQQLARSGAGAVQQLDEARNKKQAAMAAVSSAEQGVTSIEAQLGGKVETAPEKLPKYRQADAARAKAALDLKRTEIRAAEDGVITNINLEAGEYVAAGLPVFALVANTHLWIEANFKETDLTYVRAGQKAEIYVDAFPANSFEVTVASITPATGSEFSILPAQNASGNWVKVVQRIMVRLEFTDVQKDIPLAAGMSTDVTIDTGARRISRMLGYTPKAP